MKFDYAKYLVGGAKRLRPVIPIELAANGKSLRYEVLIDSGSDICIFDTQIGELLGFSFGNRNRNGEVRGVTGVPQIIYKESVEIKVGGWPHTIDAHFMPLAEGQKYGLVGQEGFFELFVVKFDLPRESIEIKPQKKG